MTTESSIPNAERLVLLDNIHRSALLVGGGLLAIRKRSANPPQPPCTKGRQRGGPLLVPAFGLYAPAVFLFLYALREPVVVPFTRVSVHLFHALLLRP